MATEMLQYLDPDGLDETVLNIGQIKTSLEGQISDLGESIEEELQNLPYARPDGLYPDMTVGAVIGADETAQWATRESTGSGAATVRSVQGAAVAYNQYVKLPYYSSDTTNSGTEATIAADGTVTIQGTTVDAGDNFSFVRPLSLIGGHKYLLTGIRRFTASGGTPVVRLYDEASGISIAQTTSASQFFANPASSTEAARLYYNAPNAGITIDLVIQPQLFDLTAIFGSGNEPTTVEEFERMYPEAYYPYSAPTLKPVQIAGIASTDAQGGELDSVEWETQTLRAAGSVADVLYSDHVDTRVGVVDLGTLTWEYRSYGGTNPIYMFRASFPDVAIPASQQSVAHVSCAEYTASSLIAIGQGDKQVTVGGYWYSGSNIYIYDTAYTDAVTFKAAMSGVLLFYELATPTTTPISPALDMTYRVQAGGSESVIVPSGEVSATPVLTIAEPVNAGDEFVRIWAAIQSLGYTRNTAQLSRPVSLTDIGSIDEVQKDTTDVVEKEAAEVAEIDTVKEVQE